MSTPSTNTNTNTNTSTTTTSTTQRKKREGGAAEGEGGEGTWAVTQFDYLQCCIPDIHGIPRGRVVPRQLIPSVMDKGFGLFQGIGNFGMNMEIPWDIQEYTDTHFANGLFLPIASTARLLPWSSSATRRMGLVLCTLKTSKGDPDPVCPRATLLRQLQRLEERGLTLKSAFELEFMVFEDRGDPQRPVGGGRIQYGNLELLDDDVDFFLDLMDTLRDMGLPVELFNNEYDPGQYEITMQPRYGVEAADAVFLARYAIRAFCRRRGREATFMAKPTLPYYASGFHLNHSLWAEDGRDVFFSRDDPLRLSADARHWIAGLLHHAPALSAVLCPTVNCYQRFGSGLAPAAVYWNVDDRECVIRAKASSSGAYLENRLPSSACNPYLALAATIAAGLDGMDRKLACPEPGPPAKEGEGPEPVRAPKSLEEALRELEKDAVLREAVGPKVLDYLAVLKKFEIDYFSKATSPDMSKAAVIEAQRKYYMPYL